MPETAEFAPCHGRAQGSVELSVDEFETIRLIDGMNQTQEECAEQMNVSRTTVQAIYDSARKKLADVLINGKSLSITGGSFEVCNYSQNCCHSRCMMEGTGEVVCNPATATCPYCHKRSNG